ncbi:recombinase family protein [Hydrogenophaga sp. BPS33]|uniref:recombinase family protein n=1 Tax=Hydrogenophaga sp. BPS33 TaxID=2651974 RepID=UPI00132032CC|nr:recombinase family protein [Hydrogenophaga sp. BPS33]QHE84877.1 recombinase family protein [Hydrogenophaga sp. BPS33]
MATKASLSNPVLPPTLACAIYTRKSSEEGLEQDFNSLHAQREACEAFVLSQKSLGWSLIPTAYDDGGFSGGNVERPSLKRLIEDIEAGKIKVIVVYKVDRLTRSLADFAKLVDLFDAKGVSFVSVTQQFNTTTSMGRLTLNVLLSFAQFEREVTAERIRDKIAASKRKGMWMGGVAPVGYRAKNRTLEFEEPHASRIRELYALYLKINCLTRLTEAVEAKGWLTPQRENKRLGYGGNKKFSRGHLHHILRNPIYAGLVHHQGEHHPGKHPALIEMALWTKVQERLKANRQGVKGASPAQGKALNPSLLNGKVFDETGRRLAPNHAIKNKKRYRYYSTPADSVGAPVRLPAVEVEQFVIRAIVDWASSDIRVLDAVGWGSAQEAARVLEEAQKLSRVLQEIDQGLASNPPKPGPNYGALQECVSRVEIAPACVRITLDLEGCGLRQADEHGKAEAKSRAAPVIEVPAVRKRYGMAVRLVIGENGPMLRKRKPNRSLVSLMERGKSWLQRFTLDGKSIEDIAEQEKLSPRYVSRVLNVALLAPDIVQALQQGEHPLEITATRLITSVPFPADWSEQRQMLGMTTITDKPVSESHSIPWAS